MTLPWRARTARNWIGAIALFCSCALVPVALSAQIDEPSAGIPTEADAPIAMLVDISSGQVLFARNETRRFVPASITKVMTMMLAFELIDEGKLDEDRLIIISEDVAQEWSGVGSSMRIKAGDEVRVRDILTAIATVSANDGSIVLAEAASGSVEAWTKKMVQKAKELGMTDSQFGTPNGWPDEGRTFVTARDLVTLAEAMIRRHPDKFARYIGQPSFTYNGRTKTNRDPLLGRVAGADGIKTGFTNEAGFGFLGTAKRGDQRLVMVIAGAYRESARGKASRDFMEWGFSAFDRRALFDKGSTVASVRVQDGVSRSVDLIADRGIFVNVPEGRSDELTMQVRYNGPLRAPIRAGERVAVLEITAPEMAPAQIPLLARSSVSKAGFFNRIANAFAKWFS